MPSNGRKVSMPQLSMVSVISPGRMLATLQPAVLLPILLIILSGCQSMPPKHIEVSPSSSVLGVNVDFTYYDYYDRVTRALARATNSIPLLAGVVFVKEPLHGRLTPELIPASWIKGSRAYLLNPEPGTYFVVAVSFALNIPNTSTSGSLGGGVTGSLSTGGSVGHTVILTEEMIQQTKTTIAPSGVEFMGALRIVPGDRINAKAEFQDDLQKQMAEDIRPGVTSATGLSGQFTMTWMVDLEKSSVTDAASDLEKFSLDAADDFEKSPWSQIVPGGLERR
jgi:hypothetical protein